MNSIRLNVGRGRTGYLGELLQGQRYVVSADGALVAAQRRIDGRPVDGVVVAQLARAHRVRLISVIWRFF